MKRLEKRNELPIGFSSWVELYHNCARVMGQNMLLEREDVTITVQAQFVPHVQPKEAKAANIRERQDFVISTRLLALFAVQETVGLLPEQHTLHQWQDEIQQRGLARGRHMGMFEFIVNLPIIKRLW